MILSDISFFFLSLFLIWDNTRSLRMLASGFSQFFIDKLARIRQSIAASLLQFSGQVFSARMHTGPTLSSLAPTSAAEVLKLLTSRPLKSSPFDVLPSVLLRSCEYIQYADLAPPEVVL